MNKANKLREALGQIAEEGVVQLFLPNDGSGAIAGIAGALQLDILAGRLQAAYGLRVTFETSRFEVARWIGAKNLAGRDRFIHAHPTSMARDLAGAPVIVAASAFDLKYERDKWPEIILFDIKDNWRDLARSLSSTDPRSWLIY